jgi:hypothetical protein
MDSLELLWQLVLHQQQHCRLLGRQVHLQALPVQQHQLLLLLGVRPACRSRVLLVV